MKITSKHRRTLIVGAALLTVTVPSFAIFGLGDIVFDPTSFGQLVSQGSTAISQLKQLQAEVTTATNTYDTIQSQGKSFSIKNLWATEVNKLKAPAPVSNTFGETNGFLQALNLNSAVASAMGWGNATLGITPGAKIAIQGQTLGSSANMSQLAIIEASDSVSPDCLNAVGAYHAARTNGLTAETSLQTADFDTADTTNSQVEQLNLLNAAQAQSINEMQAQGALHACLASQMTIANMQQRNAAAQDLNTWGFVKQQQAANPTYNVSTTGTWTTYLP